MRRRHLSLYVEWTDEADANAVRALLQRRGVCIVGTDEGTDIRPESDPLISMKTPFSGFWPAGLGSLSY